MESDHELEFDDELELQTPRQLRMGKLSDRTTHGEPSSHGIVEQSTVIKVPLKEEKSKLTVQTPSRLSPATFAKINKYQSRNGTPLKKPPITFQSNDSVEDEDDRLIKETKLLTDENKLDISVASPLRNDSRFQRSSPVRSYLLTEKRPLGTPPKYNIRTEFFDDTGRKDIKPQTKLQDSPTGRDDSPILTSKSDNVEKQKASLPQLRSDRRSSFLKHELELPDMSRAEILERMNDSILSLIESETQKKKNEHAPAEGLEADDASEESLGEAPERILDEIDLLLSSTKNPGSDTRLTRKSDLEDSNENPERIEFSPRKRQRTNKSTYSTKQEKSKVTQPIHTDNLTYYGDWPEERWTRLSQLIKLNLMSRDEIVNSDYVLKEFKCVNRNELRQRVNFLVQYHTIQDKRSKILPRRGKLRSK